MTISINRKNGAYDIKTWHAIAAFIGAVFGVFVSAMTLMSPWIRSEAAAVSAPMVAESEARTISRMEVLEKSTVERDSSMRTERLLQIDQLKIQISGQSEQLAQIRSGVDTLVRMHMKEGK
jgi:hypothetical protein